MFGHISTTTGYFVYELYSSVWSEAAPQKQQTVLLVKKSDFLTYWTVLCVCLVVFVRKQYSPLLILIISVQLDKKPFRWVLQLLIVRKFSSTKGMRKWYITKLVQVFKYVI